MAAIKGFLREAEGGSKTLIAWPLTNEEDAAKIGGEYENLAGRFSIRLPAIVTGPVPDAWPGIAKSTLQLCNRLPHLEEIGVNPDDYSPSAYLTIGDYLDQYSDDFIALTRRLLKATVKPIQLIIAFPSESERPGILGEFTGGPEYGLLDSYRLLEATTDSRERDWWEPRRGLLTESIIRLSAKAVAISPTASVSMLRRYGSDALKTELHGAGYESRSQSEVQEFFERCDLGRVLLKRKELAPEYRGRPSPTSVSAFSALSKGSGFMRGADKELNKAFAVGMKELGVAPTAEAEKKLTFARLIPDIRIETDDLAQCIEMHWRSGDFLRTGNRYEVSTYILRKLKDYAIALEWATE